MTSGNDQDPDWWRRGMSRRAQLIVVLGASLVVAGGIVYVIVKGIPFF